MRLTSRVLTLARLCSTAACSALAAAQAAKAESFQPLDVFESRNGELEIDLTAKPAQVMIGPYAVTTNVYEIRYREPIYEATPAGQTPYLSPAGTNLYGGALLKLRQSDHLKINLRNRLDIPDPNPQPNAPPSTEQSKTNLHTHGLLVAPYASRSAGMGAGDAFPYDLSPRRGDRNNGAFGDFVFVLTTPPGAQTAAAGAHMGHGAAGAGQRTAHPEIGSDMKFDIKIPGWPGPHDHKGADEHPSGIFWFHPHPHGFSKMQISGGMAGMIRVGELSDYACVAPKGSEDGCFEPGRPGLPVKVRHMLLKDAQLVDPKPGANGAPPTARMNYDQAPDFCGVKATPSAFDQADAAKGFCKEDAPTAGQEPGGWYFTVNGVLQPDWRIAPPVSALDTPVGEIWSIQNASANVTYRLQLQLPYKNADGKQAVLPFQPISLDGVGFEAAAAGGAASAGFQETALIMPGSRMEIYVAWRDPALCKHPYADATACAPAIPGSDKVVTLRQTGFAAGAATHPDQAMDAQVDPQTVPHVGDVWPPASLAKITFGGRPQPEAGLMAAMQSLLLLRKGASGPTAADVARMAKAFAPPSSPRLADVCKGGAMRRLEKTATTFERRRIYFAIGASGGKEDFVLGHSVVRYKNNGDFVGEYDESGRLLAGTPASMGPELSVFDPGTDLAELCVPFDATEDWELVNLSSEVHNFHIHQSKFTIPDPKSLRPDPSSSATPEPVMRVHDRIDDVTLKERLSFAGKNTPVEHDTIIVPRGAAVCADEAAPALLPGAKPGSYVINPASPCRLQSEPGSPIAGLSPAVSKSGGLIVRIPFDRPAQIGRFVFHCHILEHEDRGMMASIRVIDDYQTAATKP